MSNFKNTYDPEMGASYNDMSNFLDKDVRKGFIRKVYSLLTLQLLFTSGITALFVTNDSAKSFANTDTGQGLLILSVFITIATFIGPLCCCIDTLRKYPSNYIILSIFTLAMSYMVAIISTRYSQITVLYGFIITSVITFSLTIYAMNTKTDFTTSGGILVSILIGLIVMGLLNIFFQNNFIDTLIAAVGAILFSIYIIYDTQLIVGGNHRKYQFDVDDYVFATISLYLDIINLFLYMLDLLNKRN